MTLYYLIRLRPGLNAATLNDVASYMRSSSSDECLVEAHGTEQFIRFADDRALALFAANFLN